MGVRLRGEVCNVLVDGREVGRLYRWQFVGEAGAWLADAAKYRITEPLDVAEFRFVLDWDGLEIGASGVFESAVVADGVLRRESVELKGDRSWLRQQHESN